jgi:hypothetical protein
MTCNRVKTEVIQEAQIHAIRSSFYVVVTFKLVFGTLLSVYPCRLQEIYLCRAFQYRFVVDIALYFQQMQYATDLVRHRFHRRYQGTTDARTERRR